MSPDERRKRRREYQRRYRASPNGSTAQARYDSSHKGRATRKRYDSSPKGRAAHARYKASPAYRTSDNRSKGYLFGARHVTGTDLDSLLAFQGGCCPLCRLPLGPRGTAKGAAQIDHSHSDNQVRALMCSDCNVGLGRFEPKLPYLPRSEWPALFRYLEAPPATLLRSRKE